MRKEESGDGGAGSAIEEPTSYLPSWSELGVVAGLFGLVAFIMLVFGRVFPFVPGAHPHATVKPTAGFKRRVAAISSMVVAIGLIITGLSDSFRLWRPDEGDPVVPFAPVIFAVGVMLLFVSAIIYEVFPDRKPTPREEWNAEQKRRASSLGIVHLGERGTIDRLAQPEHRVKAAHLVRLASLANDALRRRDVRGASTHFREMKTIIDGFTEGGSH